MDKKQKPLAAVWNQVDKPLIRRVPTPTVLDHPDLTRLDGKNKKMNHSQVVMCDDQYSNEKFKSGCKSQARSDSFKDGLARYSCHTGEDLKTEDITGKFKSLSVQKSHGSKNFLSSRPKNTVESMIHGNKHASHGNYKDIKQNSNANYSRLESMDPNQSKKNCSKKNVHHDRNDNLNPESKNNEHFRNRHIKPISIITLKELVTKEPNEILLKISQKNSPFKLLFGKEDIHMDAIALILITLGKVCSADLKQTLCTFLNFINSKTDFLIISIQTFLVSLRLSSMKNYHLESLSQLVIFLQKFQHTLPSSASKLVSILLPLLHIKCEQFLNGCTFYNVVMDNLKDIEEQNEYFLSQHTNCEMKKASKREALKFIEPPENFRSLSILPSIDDIYSDAFLRPNIVEGKYCHTEHYLDVQYRLLREDYVKPLRDGIGEYVRFKEAGKSVKNFKDARVYENVRIVKQEFVNGSMLHIAQLSGEKFSRIKWEYSKRFLSGSLLCLSSDDFKTMLFASVARRIPEQLKKGLLLIRFEEISNEVLNISPLKDFVIIETSAYFEAYRYNLRALHELNEDVLPFKEYIVNVETDTSHPQYLDNLTTYDMRPLLLPMDSIHIKREISVEGKMSFQYEFPDNVCSVGKSAQVLNDSSWPCASDFNLDNSQYLALKAAITREFAIIQGPPGTGKTYIGLRIVQLLLHNIDKWFNMQTNSLPILVVCFTNHALDQFLEGMMSFTDNIVRIGGRGSNEAVSQFQLNNLKKNAIKKKELPKHIGTALWLLNQEIKSLKNDIDKSNTLLIKCLKNVLSEKDLKSFIPDTHYDSLKSIVYSPEFRELNLSDDDLLIHDWLGIRSRLGWNDFQDFSETKDELKNLTEYSEPPIEEMDDVVESTEEADIEFIEAERDIDGEDFEGVSFDIVNHEKEEFLPFDNYGWQYQGGKKQRLKYIKNCLTNSEALEETKALKISNVWALNLSQRWNLYKYWLEKMITKKQEECLYLQDSIKVLYQQLCEARTEEDIHILKRAHVVGMTTTGAAKYRNIVQRLNPQILIVEEAAEILESHIVTSLAPNTQHLILIGDHQQLQPSPTVHMLAVKYDLNISLFERMIKNKMECFKLSMQHRMRPDITDLIVPHIYKELNNHPSVTEYEDIKGVGKNIFFINHDYGELQENDSKSKSNEHEAKFLVKLCNYFIQQGYNSSQITVLTTYSGQLFVMKKIAKMIKILQNVRFTVVDNYQGEENDIILISFVRSNEEGEIGFLKVANRVCVALSRARKGLYCIGNFELLSEKSDLWKNITKTLRQKKAIGQSLQLLCQNHPDVYNEVSKEKDFESVPEGGCTKTCTYRLSCGHVCSLMCHPYDQMHLNVRCFKPCNRTCEEGHECSQKCYQKCKPCEFPVSCKIFPCEHVIKVPCSKKSSDILCTAKCDKKFICGHTCPKKCGENCDELCKEIVSVKSPICGHFVSVECYNKNCSEELLKICTHPCNAILECDHKCNGNCADCHQGRLHVACNQPCKRILVCGHECKSPCAKSCPPCKLPCENRCIHSKCPRQCGEPCDLCTEKCEWYCQHNICTRLCGEICSRVPCNEPCGVILKCGHSCIGFCGEPCPQECRICDSKVVKEIFFGTEEEDDARFVQLEDCNHILEISGLNEWIRSDNESNRHIKMKVCPKCKTVIRTNLRFGNVVKDCLKKIEKVKQKTFGSVDSNKLLQLKLLRLVEKNKILLSNLKYGAFSLFEFLKKILTSGRCRSIQEITSMENVTRISLELADLQFKDTLYASQALPVKEGVSVVTSFIQASKNWLVKFMYDEILTASEQQLKQLSWEVHRCKLSCKFVNFTREHVIKYPNSDFQECVHILTNYSSFGESSVKKFSDSYKILQNTCGSAVINVSDLEKASILKAMNLSVGHWYECPNGHVYCITECGGAMEESKCNECHAKIGGVNHTLLPTNRVSRDMDGATHSAWSDAVNLQNYILDLLD